MASISDAHHDRPLVVEVHHADQRAKRKGPMAGGHRVHIEPFSTGGKAAVEDAAVPGSDTAEHTCLCRFREFRLCKRGRRRARYWNREGRGCGRPGKQRIRQYRPGANCHPSRGQIYSDRMRNGAVK